MKIKGLQLAEKHRTGARLLALLLLACVVLRCAPLSRAADDGGSSSAEVTYETKTIYHWSRFYSKDQLLQFKGMSVPVLIMWGGSDQNGYYTHGSTVYGARTKDSAYIQYGADEFYTQDDCEAWNMWVLGTGDRHTINFQMQSYDGTKWIDESGDTLKFNSYSKRDTFSISFGAEKGTSDYTGYNEHTKKGYSMIMRQCTGSDMEWEFHTDHIEADSDSSWDYDQWIVYINDYTLENAQLDSYTVQSGTTLQLKGDVLLKDGADLQIMPGAVVSVEGNFFNNGNIWNFGTLIIKENATLAYFDPQTSSGGSIYSFGGVCSFTEPCEGNVIIMPGAKLLLPGFEKTRTSAWDAVEIGATFELLGGANCVNYGILMVPGQLIMSDSQLRNEGTICSHARFSDNLGLIQKATVQDFAQGSDYGYQNISGIQNAFVGSKNVIENYGTWINFSEYKISGCEVILREATA